MRLIVLCIFFTNILFSQNENEILLYEKANAYLEALNGNDKNYLPTDEDREKTKKLDNIEEYSAEKAFLTYQTLYKKYPNSKNITIYTYHLANLTKDISEKKLLFLKILENYTVWKYYQFEALKELAFISFQEGNTVLGCEYYNKLVENPRKAFSCGVEYSIYESQMNLLKTKCENLNKK
ncbi:hypothetical protein ACFS5J_12290 [Flavobacterium chuncheonense]|uniref:Tetratricopeptide repeat protein n=1 Tax=Flavobacterium chuncheonense TaxID=2026653 RepID=A0ABW5YNW7_9FLAO